MRSEDDLTYKLGDIIKASANVCRCKQEGVRHRVPAHVIMEFEQLLQVGIFLGFLIAHIHDGLVLCRYDYLHG
jgi:hypothetical protein